ncbi:MAG: LysR family transcriptional regulator, partial [Candidatus Saccharibacteria bacterium]|nr:LysR family transcriptional regulator [Pseudorhodobacter sp.]
MKIEPNHLTILAAIIDAGGLGEGAVTVGKSQPSLSRTVALLEARLGTKLFEAGKKPLRPTELCQTLAEQGRIITRANRAAEQAAQAWSGGKSGTARIAGTPIFMDGVISTMIACFQMAFPDVAIHQTYGYLPDLTEQLRKGNIDLAICPVSTDQVPDGLAFEPILRGRNVIACAPNHPLIRRASLTLSDMAAYPWIAPPVGSPLYTDLRNTLNGIGITDFRVSFTGGSLASIFSVLAGSQALTVLPYSVVFMQNHTKSVAALPVKIEHPVRQLGLLRLADRTDHPAVLRFRRYV